MAKPTEVELEMMEQKLGATGLVEAALVLYSGQPISASFGGYAAVDFDFETIWKWRQVRDFDPFLLEWHHVHPRNFGVQPSSQDLLCAQALQAAFGELGPFGIVCFKDNLLTSIQHERRVYRLGATKLVPGGWADSLKDHHLHMLKALAVAGHGDAVRLRQQMDHNKAVLG